MATVSRSASLPVAIVLSALALPAHAADGGAAGPDRLWGHLVLAQATTASSGSTASPQPKVAPASTEPSADTKQVAITPPSDPIEKGAFDTLSKHCARCHQEGPLLTKRVRPPKFGNVLKLEELAQNAHLVLPGNPDGSQLFNQLAKREMPYDLYNEFDTSVPEPTADEIKALRTWIERLGQKTAAACETRTFVTNKDLVGFMAADLEKLRPDRIRHTRYVTLAHFYNACIDDKDMEGYRQGVVKLLNSLSRNSDVVRLETADPNKTVIRFNLDDLNWTSADWATLIAAYPYGSKPDTTFFSSLTQLTHTPLPYVRGDWLAFAAGRPPLYHALLKLPDHFVGLQRQFGVDVEANLRRFLAQRAGFQRSGVSANNRLIERHAISTGYFWTSYDFAGNEGRQSLFKFPLGPDSTFHHTAMDLGFKADGGETIFSLPNGFQGYYLSTADGKRLDKGPIAIVRDTSQRDLSVTNGISCFGCHDQGIRKNRDEIRAEALANRDFPKAVRDAVAALHPTPEVMDAVFEDDGKKFRAALQRAGIDPALKVRGTELILALSAKYEETVDLRMAAAEFGLKPEAFKEAAAGAGPTVLATVRRLEQGLIPRDQLEKDFAAIVTLVNDEAMLHLSGAPGAHRIEVAKAHPAAATHARTFDLSLTSDKTRYRQHDAAILTVIARESCHLTLINVDDKGKGTIIFPNAHQRHNRIEGGREFRFGDGSSPFRFRLADRGVETVIAECNASRPASNGLEPDHRAGGFTDLGDFGTNLSRQIAIDARTRKDVVTRQIRVEGAKPTAHAHNASALSHAAGPPDIVARTAIKLQVH